MTFLWSPSSPPAGLAAPQIRHVLFYFDGPKMVLACDARERQLLGVAADEDDEGHTRWVFAAAAPERIVMLLRDRRGFRALFEAGLLEIHDLTGSWESVASWVVNSDDVPGDLLPDADAELPSFTSEFSAMLIAEQTRYVEQRGRVARTTLYFSGRPVHGRRGISASFAAEALGRYQDIVSLAYGAQKTGGLSSTGPIPARDGSTLLVTDMPRGSVGFELVEDVTQERTVPNELSEVVSQVGAFLDAAATSDEAYAESAAEFDRRVVGAVNVFLQTLKKSDACLRLEVRSREYVFDRERISYAAERTATAFAEDSERIAGKLIGFLPTDRRFELAADGRVVKGKISRDADISAIGERFRQDCVANLLVVRVERRGRVTEAFTLLSVEAGTLPIA